MPHLRRGSRSRLHAVARPRARPAAGVRPWHARRWRRERRIHGAGLLRLDDRQARRLGRGSSRRRSRGWRARCDEYQVLGIRTTIPFFQWLMRQPEYREGRYDTTYLDRLLAERGGHSFTELDPGAEELVTMAAAIDAWLRASAAVGANGRPAGDGRGSLWLRTARAEAVRRMTFEVEVNGHTRSVAVEQAGRRTVQGDGRRRRALRRRVPSRRVRALADRRRRRRGEP